MIQVEMFFWVSVWYQSGYQALVSWILVNSLAIYPLSLGSISFRWEALNSSEKKPSFAFPTNRQILSDRLSGWLSGCFRKLTTSIGVWGSRIRQTEWLEWFFLQSRCFQCRDPLWRYSVEPSNFDLIALESNRFEGLWKQPNWSPWKATESHRKLITLYKLV